MQRAEARLRRAEALARLGRADEADAEIRAATLEPVRAAHRPAVLVARMTFAQALSARARGDHALAERRLREAEGHWRRLAGEDDARARAPGLARRPRAPAGHRRRRPGGRARARERRSCEDWRPMPTFDDSATSERAGRGGVEAALRPGAVPGVVGGRSRPSSRAATGGFTVYPDGYPDFPMPQELRAAGDGRGLTISCLVSYLVFEWRLEPLDAGHAHRACTSRSPRRRRTGSTRQRGGSERVAALTRRAAPTATAAPRARG